MEREQEAGNGPHKRGLNTKLHLAVDAYYYCRGGNFIKGQTETALPKFVQIEQSRLLI